MKQLHIKSGTYERIAIEILDNVDAGVPYVSNSFFVEQDDDVIQIEISAFLYWANVPNNYQYGLATYVLTDVSVVWFDIFADGKQTDFSIEKLIKRMLQ